MHIEIQNRTTTKTYGLTSAYPEKPYIKVNNSSILPLTTNTTSGLQLKVKIGSTSTSSTGYLTTAVESSELQSVTALTEAVTTGTSYLTVESSRDVSFMLTSQENRSWHANFTNETRIVTGGSNLTSTDFRTYSHTLKSGDGATITTTQSSFVFRIANGFTATATTADAYGSKENYTHTTNAYLFLYLGSIDSSTTSTSFVYRNADKDNESVYESFSSGNNEIYYTAFSTVTGTLTGESADHTPRKTLSTIYITSDTAYTATTGTSYLTSEVTTAYSGYYSSSTIIGTINTYRPLELQSASASATYYTSGIDSVGLSNVTALTRESTSGESYLTESIPAVTAATSRYVETLSFYNMGYYTQNRTSEYIMTGTSILGYGATSYNYNYLGIQIRNNVYVTYTYNSTYNKTEGAQTSSSSSNVTNSTRAYYKNIEYTITRAADSAYTILTNWLDSVNKSQIATSGLVSTSVTYVQSATTSLKHYYTVYISVDRHPDMTITTGTSYLTCESTSGYSGISSSSSESYSWG